MSKAKKIFRTFFGDDEEFVFFNLAHRVESIDEPPFGHAVCVRAAPRSDPESFDDKPAFVMVFSRGPNESLVEWRRGKQLHRVTGPAQIITLTNGRVIQNWFEDGKKLAR